VIRKKPQGEYRLAKLRAMHRYCRSPSLIETFISRSADKNAVSPAPAFFAYPTASNAHARRQHAIGRAARAGLRSSVRRCVLMQLHAFASVRLTDAQTTQLRRADFR
jgi:hypothetical protein